MSAALNILNPLSTEATKFQSKQWNHYCKSPWLWRVRGEKNYLFVLLWEKEGVVLKEWEVEALEEIREGKLARIYSTKRSSFSLKTKKNFKLKWKWKGIILYSLGLEVKDRQTQIQWTSLVSYLANQNVLIARQSNSPEQSQSKSQSDWEHAVSFSCWSGLQTEVEWLTWLVVYW